METRKTAGRSAAVLLEIRVWLRASVLAGAFAGRRTLRLFAAAAVFRTHLLMFFLRNGPFGIADLAITIGVHAFQAGELFFHAGAHAFLTLGPGGGALFFVELPIAVLVEFYEHPAAAEFRIAPLLPARPFLSGQAGVLFLDSLAGFRPLGFVKLAVTIFVELLKQGIPHGMRAGFSGGRGRGRFLRGGKGTGGEE